MSEKLWAVFDSDGSVAVNAEYLPAVFFREKTARAFDDNPVEVAVLPLAEVERWKAIEAAAMKIKEYADTTHSGGLVSMDYYNGAVLDALRAALGGGK